jgi:hypothetical protein
MTAPDRQYVTVISPPWDLIPGSTDGRVAMHSPALPAEPVPEPEAEPELDL